MAFLAGVAKGGTGAGSGTSAAIDTTGATLIVIALINVFAPDAVADSQVNTWVPLTGIFPGSSRVLQAFYCIAPSTSAAHTFSGGNAAAAIAVAAFSNTPGSDSPSESAGAGSGGTTVQPGTLTPGAANNLMIAYMGGDADTSIAVNGVFAIAAQSLDVPSTHEGIAIAYVIQTAATAQNPTWTVGSNGAVIAAGMAEFIENGGGGGATNWGSWIVGNNWNRMVQAN